MSGQIIEAPPMTEPLVYICWPASPRLLTPCFGKRKKERKKLENVAIAKALQLEAGRRRADPIRFNMLLVASLKSLSLSVAVLERIYC